MAIGGFLDFHNQHYQDYQKFHSRDQDYQNNQARNQKYQDYQAALDA